MTPAAVAPSDPGPGPAPPPRTETPAPADPAKPGSAAVGVAPHGGSVFVRLPGSAEFIPLAAGSQLPYGSEVDAREGSVGLTSTLPSGTTQSGRFGGGRFVIQRGRRGYVDLHLRGPVCPARERRTAAGSALATAAVRRGRRLWGRDRGGRFRTHGKYSHATVRGTVWSVVDTCAGTLTRVRHGAVVVRDLSTRKRKLLEAGERYLARPRR
jgi:hypothetical protein